MEGKLRNNIVFPPYSFYFCRHNLHITILTFGSWLYPDRFCVLEAITNKGCVLAQNARGKKFTGDITILLTGLTLHDGQVINRVYSKNQFHLKTSSYKEFQ